MADLTRCDICHRDPVAYPAFRVEVGVAIWNVAKAGQPTGTVEAIDACEEHQEDAIKRLAEHAQETLREQVPFHVEIEKLNDAIGDATDAASSTAKAVLAHEHANAGLKEPPPLPEELENEHRASLNELAKLEAARHDLIREAQTVHEVRVGAFSAKLGPQKTGKKR